MEFLFGMYIVGAFIWFICTLTTLAAGYEFSDKKDVRNGARGLLLLPIWPIGLLGWLLVKAELFKRP